MRDEAERRIDSEAAHLFASREAVEFGARRCRDAEGVSCEENHCVTCSDEGVPMRVLEARDAALALCEPDVEVMTDLVGAVEPGDVLLVHAGVALARVEP